MNSKSYRQFNRFVQNVQGFKCGTLMFLKLFRIIGTLCLNNKIGKHSCITRVHIAAQTLKIPVRHTIVVANQHKKVTTTSSSSSVSPHETSKELHTALNEIQRNTK